MWFQSLVAIWQYQGKLKMYIAEETFTSVIIPALFAIVKTSEQERE